MISPAKREGYPEIKDEDFSDDRPDAEPIRAKTNADRRNPPWRLSRRVVACVEIEIDPAPKPSEVIAHIQSDNRLVGFEQMFLNKRIGVGRAMSDRILSLQK